VAAHGGHEVKWLGDGLMVAFSSAAEAVRCAIAMQQAARRPVAGERLAIRIGLHVGEPLRERDDYVGTAVVVARRLCDRATTGQILCSRLVAGLLSGRSAFHFRRMSPITARGMAEPIRVCEVVYEEVPCRDAASEATRASGAEEPPPLPALLAVREQFALAGRRAELDVLARAWDHAAAGTKRVVLIDGEPGIGKTRLAVETARRVRAAGGTVLYGRCEEELGVPFQPFVEALEHFLAHRADAGLRAALGRYAGELVRLVPEIAERVPALPPPLLADAETERYRLFEAVTQWLAAASSERAILLVLDDLHWAAKPTLLLLGHVARAGPTGRLMIIGTHRDTEVGKAHPLVELLADLRNVPGVEQVSLRGLDEAEVVEFLRQASGHDVEPAFARTVHAETGGNPLFVAEVLRHFAESGAIVQRGDRWVAVRTIAETDIPAAVRDVLLRRIGRLSGDANETLRRAAVIGRSFDLDTLAAIGHLHEEALLAALDEAIAARLVDETGVDAYRFAHVLARAALYTSLSASRRVRLHRDVGVAIEARRPADVTVLAHHFTEAGADRVGKAIAYTTRAGDQALERLAHDQAVHFYQRAIALLDGSGAPEPSQRCELLIRLGTARRNAGDATYRETLLEAARFAERLHDTDRLVRAALANNRGWVSATGAVDTQRVAVLEAALAALDAADGAPRAKLLATLAAELAYAPNRERRVALSDAALAMARRLGDPVTLAHVLNLRGHTIWAPATLPERLANSAEHVVVAARLGDPLARWYAAATRPQVCMEAGDIDEVDRQLAVLWDLTQELGHPHLRWAAAIDRAWRTLLAGRLAEAEALVTRAGELGGASGQRDALMYYAGQLLAIRFEQGRLAELAPVLEQAIADNPGVPAFRACLALAYCDADRRPDAQRILDAAFAARFEDLPLDLGWLTGMAFYAEVACRLRAGGPAALLHRLLAPWSEHVVFNGLFVFGSVSHLLGRLAGTLGWYDEAETRFATAAAVHERIGAPGLLARTRVGWAQMLLERRGPDDEARARVLLGQALAAAGDFGLAGIEGKADGLVAV
jgi:tetratricopeptide (TPR) repeat protein